MRRGEEQLAYYKRLGEESKLHLEQVEKELEQLKELYQASEKRVIEEIKRTQFYREQVLKFYEPKKRS